MIPRIPFIHQCKIYRKDLSNVDDIGNIAENILYEGKCNYQVGGSGDTSIQSGFLQTSPRIFIPSKILGLNQNDIVEVTTNYNVKLIGIIEKWIFDDFYKMFGVAYKNISFTKIWIIQERSNG